MAKEKLAKKAIMDELLKKKSIYEVLELTICCYQIAVDKGTTFTSEEKDSLNDYAEWGLNLIKEGNDTNEEALDFFREISCNQVFAIAAHYYR